MITRRKSLQQLSAMLTLYSFTACSPAPSDEMNLRINHDRVPEGDQPDSWIDLGHRLPLSTLEQVLISWAGGERELYTLSPLGEYALLRSGGNIEEWELRIQTGLIRPLEGREEAEAVQQIDRLTIEDYDALNLTELRGWWLSEREVLCCVTAALIAQQRTMENTSID